ncbi:dimethylaniline monooxygenase [N-oxide-forming] 5-like [Anneissia japonica]|uniref:dimethylaniline monooxygenase [N-oxide-forming] 5-like n=1 Tax=Anneissia japonica TaxID=1529436 RepID=UPI0014255C3E|nr:dimethylaniline monooxygenase [N-oxide-forming] 5-like [Anneissia japonica]XP_033099010.1 dimethylaniline monooxygenase [N-oxide-forming] 5-like [Anneissia japonica]XP_033099011.1 dimethylaniline monooxygenase [N-oxide-forming] 5-like [Anneissia japonica]
MPSKKIAIIGAGASGLTAIKCCLDEGLVPVCFEKTEVIGGLWNFRENRDGQACVFKSTIINTNKEMMCYSDFPIPKEFPNFMHNTYVQKYLELYAEKFDLLKYVCFRYVVEHVTQGEDFKQTGQWKVKYKNCDNDVTSTEVFDGVMVCNGHHCDPHVAEFEGQEKFKGRILHTHDYIDYRGFEGKKIVIVGVGNSGGDAAVELSRHAKQVFLSTRRGAWVLNRVSDNGLPVDLQNNTRFKSMAPVWLVNRIIEKQLNMRFNHANYGIQPEHRFLSQHPTVNDDLPNRIIAGFVKIKSNIKCINEASVEFDDGTCEDDIDIIIMATGYTYSFPFIDESVLQVDANQTSLYKYVLPFGVTPSTLAIIGLAQPLGAIMPISEIQSRWAVLLFKGAVKAPSQSRMQKEIALKKELMEKRYVKSQRHTIQVDWVPYMDEIASEFGVKPNLFKIFLGNPRFALKCLFGPCYPYQYRLMGHGNWDGAKEAMETAMDRVIYPTKTRVLKSNHKVESVAFNKMLKILVVAVIIAVVIKYSL